MIQLPNKAIWLSALLLLLASACTKIDTSSSFVCGYDGQDSVPKGRDEILASTDWEKLELRGKVSFVSTIEKEPKFSEDDTIKLTNITRYAFDENGHLVYKMTRSHEGSIEIYMDSCHYNYDKNHILRDKETYLLGELSETSSYIYSTTGLLYTINTQLRLGDQKEQYEFYPNSDKLKRKILYDEDNNVISSTQYLYDQEGRLTRELNRYRGKEHLLQYYYDLDGRLCEKRNISTNDNAISQYYHYHPDGSYCEREEILSPLGIKIYERVTSRNILGLKTAYFEDGEKLVLWRYKYDQHGNWTEIIKRSPKGIISKTTRTIRYFP